MGVHCHGPKRSLSQGHLLLCVPRLPPTHPSRIISIPFLPRNFDFQTSVQEELVHLSYTLLPTSVGRWSDGFQPPASPWTPPWSTRPQASFGHADCWSENILLKRGRPENSSLSIQEIVFQRIYLLSASPVLHSKSANWIKRLQSLWEAGVGDENVLHGAFSDLITG